MADLYAIIAWDAPDGGAKRSVHRAAHFAHIEKTMDKISVAGPFLDESGAMTGSLLLVHAASKDAAEAILQSDPYYTGGVWERWEISRFRAAAGTWVGGKTW